MDPFNVPDPQTASRFTPSAPVDHVWFLIYTGISRNFMIHGSATKVVNAELDGEKRGYMSGIAEGLASLGTQLRLQTYPNWSSVPAVMGYEMELLVKHWKAAWDNLPSDSRRGDALEEFKSAVLESYYAFVLHDTFEEQEKKRHRQAVLDRKEEPTIDDRGWLQDFRVEQEAAAASIRELAKKVGI